MTAPTLPASQPEVVTRGVPVADVEGELAFEHVIHLTRPMAVHDRCPSPGRHVHLNCEERAAGLRARGEHGDLVAPEPDPFRRGDHDRKIDR